MVLLMPANLSVRPHCYLMTSGPIYHVLLLLMLKIKVHFDQVTYFFSEPGSSHLMYFRVESWECTYHAGRHTLTHVINAMLQFLFSTNHRFPTAAESRHSPWISTASSGEHLIFSSFQIKHKIFLITSDVPVYFAGNTTNNIVDILLVVLCHLYRP